LFIGRTCAWPQRLPVTEMHFRHFLLEFSKRDSRQAKTHVDNLLLKLVDDMLSVWNTDSFLDRAQELVKKERRQEDDSVNR